MLYFLKFAKNVLGATEKEGVGVVKLGQYRCIDKGFCYFSCQILTKGADAT